MNSSFILIPLSFIELVTLYSGAFVLVLVDTNTSTGIQYIGVVTLYISGVFVSVDTNTNTGIQLASRLVASLYVKLPPTRVVT